MAQKKLPADYRKNFGAVKGRIEYEKDLRASKKTTKKKTTGAKKMPAKKKPTKRKRAKKAAGKAVAKLRYRTREVKPAGLIMNALIGAFGALGSSYLVNKIPMLNEQNKWVKAGAQAAVGVSALYFMPKKLSKAKPLAVGAVMGGAMTAVKSVTNMEVLAGGDDLSDGEIKALLDNGVIRRTSSMNGPTRLAGPVRMDGPAKMKANAGFVI